MSDCACHVCEKCSVNTDTFCKLQLLWWIGFMKKKREREKGAKKCVNLIGMKRIYLMKKNQKLPLLFLDKLSDDIFRWPLLSFLFILRFHSIFSWLLLCCFSFLAFEFLSFVEDRNFSSFQTFFSDQKLFLL